MTQKPSERAPPSPTIRVGVLGLFAACLLALPLALAPRAAAFIYWAGSDTISRANLDGTGVDQSFIGGFPVAGSGPGDLAVDAKHVYWTGCETSDPRCAIGRANLDGTGVDYSFIRNTGRRPQGIAVDANHIYWTDERGDDLAAVPVIARADLDGTNVERSFITMSDFRGIYEGSGVAVDAHHVYWTQVEAPFGVSAIGRANLDGTNIEPSFIPDTSGATDVAVDAEHIYWTFPGAGAISRANLDGSGVEPSFISAAGGSRVGGVAVDANHVYWSHSGPVLIGPGGVSAPGTIGRANLDGTGVDQDLLGARYEGPHGLAVDALIDTSPTSVRARTTAQRTQKQRGKRIRVKVKVKAKERLTARATGEVEINPTYKLKPRRIQVAAGKTKTLKLKPRKKAARRIAHALKRGEKAKAKVTLKLTDLAGNRETEKLRVRLRRE